MTPTRPLMHPLALIATALIVIAAFALWQSGMGEVLTDADSLSATIQSVGPVAVVLLLALAVIISPIPSGPIAMAAGALYGPVEGGALTAAGLIVLGFVPLDAG